jgi:hypothetical protein
VAEVDDMMQVRSVLERVERRRARGGDTPEFDAWLASFSDRLRGYLERGLPLCRADRLALDRIARRLAADDGA